MLLVADDLEVGGVSRVVVGIAKGLVRRQIPVGVMATGRGALWDELPPQVKRHASPSRRSPIAFPRFLSAVVAREAYTVVHAHQRGVALWSKVVLRGRGVTVVEHVHNEFPRTALAFLSFRGDRLIACGSAVKRMLVDDYGRPESSVVLVPNGVPDQASEARDPLPVLSRGGLSVVGVGRLSEQKDPERFVRVVDRLVARLPAGSVRATWVGDGPLRAPVTELVKELGLTDTITLLGNRDDVPAQLAAADLLLLTSRSEGLPLVALEALSASRAVVLPDVGSCRDAVAGGLSGLLYPSEWTADRIAATITERATADQLESWSHAARAVYEERFTVDQMVDGVVRVYQPDSVRIA